MKITIVGCGKVGQAITESLLSEGHEVVCIDSSSEVIEELTNVYDVMCVCGNAIDCDVLEEAGIRECDLFISVTGSDEMNMLGCYLAKRMGAGQTIARIRGPQYNDRSLGFMRSELELSDSINPEYITAGEIYNILKFPGALGIETFSSRSFEMIELRLRENSPLSGLSLAEIRRKFTAKFLVCAVERDEQAFIPGGSFVLRDGDKVGLVATRDEIRGLFKELGIFQKSARHVMILGASTTAYYLAKRLVAGGSAVKIIEKDREKCLDFSTRLPGVTMICGDGANQELLLEEGIADTDAFVALTGLDEQNILLCSYASSFVPTVVPKVNRSEFVSLSGKLGLECTVSPKRTICDVITRYARALNNSLGSQVETLYKLMDGKVEALEFLVKDDFSHAGISLRELKLQKNTLVAGIIRKRTVIIPSGNDVIMPGDKIVVFASGRRLEALSDILE